MPGADFFARFGLFVRENAFEPELCERLRSEMREAGGSPATVRTSGASYDVDANTRSASWMEVSAPMVSTAESRLLDIKPAVEQHFRLSLKGCQPLQFLLYRKGDFYRAHLDRADDPDASALTRERLVSVVVFLNSESDQPQDDAYCGGSLTLYGLMDGPQGASLGFPLVGEAGTLVAFPSGLLHEVRPVTDGERCTIVTWYV